MTKVEAFPRLPSWTSPTDGTDIPYDFVPVMLVGKGGNFKLGHHITYPQGTPMTNLYLTLLDRMGVQPEKIGDSTGRIDAKILSL